MSELYTLPNGWEWKKLGDISKKIFAGGDKPEIVSEFKTDDLNIPIYANAVKDNGLYGYSNIYKVDEECITISARGTIGFTVVRNEKFLPIVRLIVVIPNEKVLSKILKYYLDYELVENTGSSIPQLTVPTVKELFFPLPPLEEQKRIAAKLDILFARIDKAIALHQKNIDEVNVFMASVLNDVFVELEEKYKVVKISDIAHIKGGKRLPKGEKLSEKQTQYPYIRVADFLDIGTVNLETIQYITEDIHKQIKNYIITSNDLYISIAGTIGKTGIIPKELDGANLTENAAKLVYKIEDISNKYIYFLTKSLKFEEQIGLATKTVAQPKLALTRLSEVEIPLPPLKTQQKVVSYLDEISNKMEKIKQIQKEKMQSLKELKASILDKAFKGEL